MDDPPAYYVASLRIGYLISFSNYRTYQKQLYLIVKHNLYQSGLKSLDWLSCVGLTVVTGDHASVMMWHMEALRKSDWRGYNGGGLQWTLNHGLV